MCRTTCNIPDNLLDPLYKCAHDDTYSCSDGFHASPFEPSSIKTGVCFLITHRCNIFAARVLLHVFGAHPASSTSHFSEHISVSA